MKMRENLKGGGGLNNSFYIVEDNTVIKGLLYCLILNIILKRAELSEKRIFC